MENKPIGIFDSGIGGLTVLKEIIKILPNEKYIYYADTENVPYGTKPKEEVKEYIKKAMNFFVSKDVKAVVIACNTATSIAINDIRKTYDMPIIGIEPAAKPAIENRSNKRVLIMATPTTIKEEKLRTLLNRLDKQHCVDLIAMPKLVEFAESGEIYSERVKDYIKKELENYNLSDYSELVLGCTHFPLFKKALSEIFPKETKIIDGSIGVAKRLKSVLIENELLGNNNLNIDYYYSGKKVNNPKELEKIKKIITYNPSI